MKNEKTLRLSIANLGICLVLLAGLLATSTSYADRFVHTISGQCIHPYKRPYDPENNTKLVLHSDDCTVSDSRLDFIFEDKHIKHVLTGKCVRPEDGSDSPKANEKLVLHSNCSGRSTEFEQLPGGEIKHAGTGHRRFNTEALCIAPKESQGDPNDNTDLVLLPGCHGISLAFNFVPLTTKTTLVYASSSKTKLVHPSGSCVHPKGRPSYPKNNTLLVFHSASCTAAENRLYFTMNSNGSIEHVISGKCIHPKEGRIDPSNNTKLVLHDGCVKESVQFKKLSNGAIQHKGSEKCIHPKGGSDNPKDNTQLVLYDGCDSESKLRLDFIK